MTHSALSAIRLSLAFYRYAECFLIVLPNVIMLIAFMLNAMASTDIYLTLGMNEKKVAARIPGTCLSCF
jgi:hypothetical protein